MPTSIFSAEVADVIRSAQSAARAGSTRDVTVDGATVTIPQPFPSPGDWRDTWIYFLMLDRFNNPGAPPKGTWNRRFDFRHGGTFKGVQAQLGYLRDLGVGAIWLSPVVRNPAGDTQFNYHGYAASDFLNLDERFASDGTAATAEREFRELVDEAHARGIYVVLDIVLNHAARVFDYVRGGGVTGFFEDAGVINGPLGSEPPVRWRDASGKARADWQDNLPPSSSLAPGDAAWPDDLQRHVFFRRRGGLVSHDPGPMGFVSGDFGAMRQLVVEYDAGVAGQENLRNVYGARPVLTVLVRACQYLIARYDLDGFRIDTVKYVAPEEIEHFGNAIREFALSIGKKNFFTFGEIYDDEETIARFVGRNGGGTDGFGIDAALDFPLFFTLPAVAKGMLPVETIRHVFEDRKRAEKELLSTHGEAGRFFVSFLDNHDQPQRIRHPATPEAQVSMALALLFCLQGIPCVYYGTEQGVAGAVDAAGAPDLTANESTREALWGRPGGFDKTHPAWRNLQALSRLRKSHAALAYGRLYFREVSGNGTDFGHSAGTRGLVAFSRILAGQEIVTVANTSSTHDFTGHVVVDRDLHPAGRPFAVEYSNIGTPATARAELKSDARFHRPEGVTVTVTAALPVRLKRNEIQVLAAV